MLGKSLGKCGSHRDTPRSYPDCVAPTVEAEAERPRAPRAAAPLAVAPVLEALKPYQREARRTVRCETPGVISQLQLEDYRLCKTTRRDQLIILRRSTAAERVTAALGSQDTEH